jgi:diacylglycerol kinase (ATP)
MSGPRLVLVANPTSGGGRARAIAERARGVMLSEGVDVDLVVPEGIDAMRESVAAAVESAPTGIVACGGDGTVHLVLQGAASHSTAIHSTAMAIIPAGTGNDVARSLGIARKGHDQVARVIARSALAGRFRAIDLTRLEHGSRHVWSLGVTSTGLDSAVNERANRTRRFNGTTRYVLALLSEMRSFRTYEYVVTVDGERMDGPATLIAIGNGSSYGGGMLICPSASMTDGILDITWVDRASRTTILRVFPRIFSGSHVEHPAVRVLHGRTITVEAKGPVVYADGERIGDLPIVATAVAGGLRMLDQR